jgi:hypothetical protein
LKKKTGGYMKAVRVMEDPPISDRTAPKWGVFKIHNVISVRRQQYLGVY